MEYQNLGKSGLKVSKIILGCMSYGSKTWHDFDWIIEDEAEVFKLLKYAYDHGIRTWDTADVYSNGRSEELIGKFIKEYKIPRESLVILSKVFFVSDNDGTIAGDSLGAAVGQINRQGLSRKHILDAVEASTKRLGTYIDVYQIHRLDRSTPKEEIMEALHDVVKSGKVRYIGASAMRGVEFAQLQFIAELRGWTKFISVQSMYSLLYREEEKEMYHFCKDTGVGLTPYSPLMRGKLCRPFDATQETSRQKGEMYQRSTSVFNDEASKTIVDRVEELSKKKGVSMATISTAWAIAKGTNPILGLSSTKRIDEAIGALGVHLTEEEINYLEEPYVPKPITGYTLDQTRT